MAWAIPMLAWVGFRVGVLFGSELILMVEAMSSAPVRPNIHPGLQAAPQSP